MQTQTELETELETLGHIAAQCELYAVDRTLTDHERIVQQIRANALREKQYALLQTSELEVSCRVAESIMDEMLAAGAGYDAQGNWHLQANLISDPPDTPYSVGEFPAVSNVSKRPAATFLIGAWCLDVCSFLVLFCIPRLLQLYVFSGKYMCA